MLTGAVRSQALDDARVSLTQYVNGVLHDELVHDGRVTVAGRRCDRRAATSATGRTFSASRSGRPTARSRGRISRRSGSARATRSTGHLGEAIEDGVAEAELESLDEDRGRGRVGPRRRPGRRGLRADPRRQRAADRRLRDLRGRRRGSSRSWPSAADSSGWSCSRSSCSSTPRSPSSCAAPPRGCIARAETLKQRSNQLLDSYRELEQSSLEAIELLNATVEARDPYTAGHSARVQRIALAVGLELDLDSARMTALGHAALFHDVGKLAVPDAVLLKPAKLDAGRVRADQAARREGRRDRRQPRPPPRRGTADPPPPRALGRSRLSGRPRRRRDPGRGGDRRSRRRLGRDDDGPPLCPCADARGGARRDSEGPGLAVQPSGRGRVPRCRAAATCRVLTGDAFRPARRSRRRFLALRAAAAPGPGRSSRPRARSAA